MLRDGRLGFVSLIVSTVVVACGARSELLAPDETPDASFDAGMDAHDASHEPDAVFDAPDDVVDAPDVFDAPDDVMDEDHTPDADADAPCSEPTQCDPGDPSHILQCGAVVQQ